VMRNTIARRYVALAAIAHTTFVILFATLLLLSLQLAAGVAEL